MNTNRKLLKPGVLAALWVSAGVLLAQTAPKVLVINGKTSDVAVRQMDGHSYVDVEALAEITNGTVTIEPSRVVLNIPSGSTAPVATAVVATSVPAPPPEGLSRAFAGSAIATQAEMREWRGAIETMITYGLAVSAAWAQGYHDRSQASLMEAEVAASSDSDQSALQLLQNEFNLQSSWANDVMATREALNGAQTVNPNALQDDATLAKLRACGSFLDSMVVSGVFADNANCH